MTVKRHPHAPAKDSIPVIAPDETCNARKRQHSGTKKSGTKGKDTTKSPYCSKPAGWGTDHVGVGRCKLHGGSVPNHRANAMEQIAEQGVEAFGLPVNVDPHDALIEELRRTAGIIAFYEQQIRELKHKELHGPVGTSGHDAESGLEHHPKSAMNIWVVEHREERKHYVKVAETCIRAGIEERRVQIAEREGAVLAMVIRGILGEMKVSLTDPKNRDIIRNWLMKAGTLQPPAIEGKAEELTNGRKT